MAISGRAVAFAAAGLVPLVVAPRLLTVIAWLGALVAACAVDLAAAAPVRGLGLTR